MLGGTRAGTKALKMAELRSRDQTGSEEEDPALIDTEGLDPQSEISHSGPKSLRERAADIVKKAAKGSEEGGISEVAKDAAKDSNVEEVSPSTRETRQSSKDGGGQDKNKPSASRQSSRQSSKSSSSRSSGSSSKSRGSSSNSSSRSSGGNPRSSSSRSKNQGTLIDDILEEQNKTFGSSGDNQRDSAPPPMKKTKRNEDRTPDISIQLLSAINALNSSISESSLGMKQGMQQGFEGLASNLNQKFSELSRSWAQDSSEDEEVEISEHSEEEEEIGNFQNSPASPKKGDHQLSDSDEDLRDPNPSNPQGVITPPKDPKNALQSPSLPKEGKEGSETVTGTVIKNSLFAKKRAEIVTIKDTSEDLDEDLAIILMDRFWGQNIMSKEQFLEKMTKSLRPNNVPALQTPALQDCIWRKLPENIKGKDKWDRLTQMNLMVVWREIAKVINNLGKHETESPWVADIIESLLDVFSLAGYINNFNFVNRRRDTLRPGLPVEFKRLAGEGFPPSPEWLFGDDLGESVDKISRENKLTEKIFQKPKPKQQGQIPPKKGGFHQNTSSSGGGKQKKKLKFKNRKASTEYHSPLPQEGNTPTSFDRKPQNQGKKDQKGHQSLPHQAVSTDSFSHLIIPFRVGNVANCWENWLKITSDREILEMVKGVKIEFEDLPTQNFFPREYRFNQESRGVIQAEVQSLVQRKVVSQVRDVTPKFVSNIFIRPKPNGKFRLILDLSTLNDEVVKKHFKMTHLDSAIALMTRGCYMGSIDLKDAYYSVPVRSNFRAYLCFSWEGKLYHFNALPFGLTSAPRVFTKILKPVFSDFRANGHEGFAYLDDCFVIGKSFERCQESLLFLARSLAKLGFSIHREKSVLVPTQELTFLGYVLNSVEFTVRPNPNKIAKLKIKIGGLLDLNRSSIREAASALGLMNDMCKGVDFGLAHVKSLEVDKIRSLKRAGQAQFDGVFHISKQGGDDLQWWKENMERRTRAIRAEGPSLTLTTDASNLGWGAVFNDQSTGGRWSQTEGDFHINVLELIAVELGLKTFLKEMENVHVRVVSDNTTVVAYLNHMGGTRSSECNAVAHRIWGWCETREIWLTAAHLPGVENIEADHESRNFTENTEWQLNPSLFNMICEQWGRPDIDLFASRLNCQIPNYCSWVPDPGASWIDAFSFKWDQFRLIYAFPPFSLLTRVLQRIKVEKVPAIVVIPNWRGQTWWSVARNMAKETIKIHAQQGNLIQCVPGGKQNNLSNTELLALLF